MYRYSVFLQEQVIQQDGVLDHEIRIEDGLEEEISSFDRAVTAEVQPADEVRYEWGSLGTHLNVSCNSSEYFVFRCFYITTGTGYTAGGCPKDQVSEEISQKAPW